MNVSNKQVGPSMETATVTERLLSDCFGGAVRLGDGEDLGGSSRSKVYRFNVLGGSGGMPESVIVKQAQSVGDKVYNPDAPDIPAWTLFNEWASLEFLSRIADAGVSFGPRFYSGDRASGLIVMEDLGTGQRLDHFLLGNDSARAEEALVDFAAIHGRMHAFTAGKRAEFESIRKALGPSELVSGYDNYNWLTPTLHETADLLAIPLTRQVDVELAMLTVSMRKPGPFLVYTQGDSCPDNCLFVNATVRLLDFEGGRFSHALKEGVYGRIHFPTCWCVYRMPEHVTLHMEEAYRAELAKGCPEAADDILFYRAVVEACVFWMLDWYHEFPPPALLEKDRTIVTSTVRQRLLMRSEILAKTAEDFGHMEAIGAVVRVIAAKLRASWPEADHMPYYPAFR
jgi:hypothetical protein